MRLTATSSPFPPRGYRLPSVMLEVDGIAMRAVRLGAAYQPALVALCPPFASPRVLAPLRPLASRYRLLMIDAPGARSIDEFLAASWLPERFALLAASGAICSAVAIARRAPARVRALVLTGAPTERTRTIGWALHVPMVGHLAARWLGGRHLPREARCALVREARRGRAPELEGDVPPVPTLMIGGGEDPLGCWRPQGAAIECIPEAAHLPFLSHPVAFNGLVDEFLKQVPA